MSLPVLFGMQGDGVDLFKPSKAVKKAALSILDQGEVRRLADDVEASVTSNHMHNTASVYHEALALGDGDPGLLQLLGRSVAQYASRRV